MKFSYNKKIVSYGIIILFIGAAVLPSISGNTKQYEEAFNSILLNDDYINSYWKLDECSGNTIGDSSSPSYNGARNGATWTTNGYSGCALIFDGVDDYVNFSSLSSEVMFNKTDDVIITFYFKSTGKGIIFSGTAPWGFHPDFRIELYSNGTLFIQTITQACGIQLFSNGSYNDGEWHFVKYYHNGISASPTTTLYVDNVFDTTVTHYLCEIVNTDFGKCKMGMHAFYSSDYFDGYIDEFKIVKYEGGNEQYPPIIDGPTSGQPGVEYDYTFTLDDPEDDDIEFLIDWGDGTEEDWRGPYSPGEEVTVSHTWDEEGTYNVTAKTMDLWDDSTWSDNYVVRIGNQPPEPPIITGPKCGDPGETLTYTFVTDDFEGHDIYYNVDWGDGDTSGWLGPHASGEETTASHSWDTEGEYEIKAKAKDELGSEGEWSGTFLVRIGSNSPPEAPDIDGPRKGTVDVDYGFIFQSTDPDGDDVCYEIDWGDGTSDEEGPISSGEEVIVNHAWEIPATYTIKARARDEPCGETSEWSELDIEIPRNRAMSFNLIEWLIEQFPYVYEILKYILKI